MQKLHIFAITAIVILGLFYVAGNTIQIPYTAMVTYTESEPYTVQDCKDIQVPYTEEECNYVLIQLQYHPHCEKKSNNLHIDIFQYLDKRNKILFCIYLFYKIIQLNYVIFSINLHPGKSFFSRYSRKFH